MPESSLQALPVELLYEVQSYALSESLPCTCKHLHLVFKMAPSSVPAHYLIEKYYTTQTTSALAQGVISKALRFPVCTTDVLECMFRSPICPPTQLIVPELPKRLFRALAFPPQVSADTERRTPMQWNEDDEPIPFLRYLYTCSRTPPPDPNSHDGYPLTKAVYAGFVPLVRFLLDHGASPTQKKGLAAMVAIRRKDLSLLKLLIERDYTSGGCKKSKRRRLEDRMGVTSDMLKTAVKCNAMDIVQYLIDKGCVPDMQTLKMIAH